MPAACAAFTYDPYLYPFYPYVKTRNWRSAKNDKADVQITRDIEAQLFWSPFVSSDQVHVFVENGKATLTGEVGSMRERKVATQDAYAGHARGQPAPRPLRSVSLTPDRERTAPMACGMANALRMP